MLKTIKWFSRAVVIVVSIVLTIMLVRAFDARRLPDLQPWHTASVVSWPKLKYCRADDSTPKGNVC